VKFSGILACVVVVAFALAQVYVACAADANPPERMTYQGYLVDANGYPLGSEVDPGDSTKRVSVPANYDVVFRIYNRKQGGGPENLLWAEQQTITVDMGYFSVLLGEGTKEGNEPRDDKISTAFIGADSSGRYIGITVKALGDGGDVEIAPRLRLVASPFTFLAAYARQADKIVGADGDVLTTDGGNIGIGNASPDAKLDVAGSIKASGAVDIGEDANVQGQLAVGKSTAPSATLDVAGTVKASGGLDIGGDSSIDGTLALTPSGVNNALEINPASGTSYKLSLRSDSSASYIRNNSSQQDLRLGANSLDAVTIKPSGKVGIGTTNPRGSLDVFTGNTAVPGLIIDRSPSGNYRSELYQAADGLAIYVGNNTDEPTEKMRIKHDGKVGIGTTSPGSKLHLETPNAATNLRIVRRQDGGTQYVPVGTELGGIQWMADDYTWSVHTVGAEIVGEQGPLNYNGATQHILFKTSGSPGSATSERMRITNGGNVGIGTPSPEDELHIVHAANTAYSKGLRIQRQDTDKYWTIGVDSTGDLIYKYKGGDSVAWDAYVNDTSGAWVSGSDKRLKKDIEPVGSVLDRLVKLKPSRFRFKTQTEDETKLFGFVAQEVQDVFPDMVSDEKNRLGLAYDDFGVLSVKAIQELRAEKDQQLADLGEQLAEKTRRNDELEARLAKLEELVGKMGQGL